MAEGSKRNQKTSYWELAEELKPSAEIEMDIPSKYLDLAKEYIQPENDSHKEQVDNADATEKLLNTAIVFQDLYQKAREQGINLSRMRLYYGTILVGERQFDLNKKGSLKAILTEARREKPRRLDRLASGIADWAAGKPLGWSTAGKPLGAIIGLASGLFFLSSNLTGNVIGNLTNTTSSIIGAVLFVGGLVAAFFWAKK
ncbi:MAG: hypothetical protein Q7S06_03070 [Nanoarchaeota archaeon]|nr:hypothetical protein [Nanoarchaeota archaeon]